jgi:hypothetical protein
MMGSLMTFTSHPKYCSGDKIKKNEMGGACSAYGGGVVYIRVCWRNLVRGVEGRIILRWTFRK